MSESLLPPDHLWNETLTRTAAALASGALQPIATTGAVVEAAGVRFLVRVVANLARKDAERSPKVVSPDFNPFLPYDPELFVGELTETHRVLLNKFNVVEHHLLIVTRRFEEQLTLLTEADFEAAWFCLDQIDGLVFYNAGEAAGASQRHKHLQMIPLPVTSEGPPLPVAPLFATARFDGEVGTVPALPFRHALARLSPAFAAAPDRAGRTLDLYRHLLGAVGLPTAPDLQPTCLYNLLLTREWLFVVPRIQEKAAGISVNAVGFAGGLLVRTEEQLTSIREHGPLAILTAVAAPWPDDGDS